MSIHARLTRTMAVERQRRIRVLATGRRAPGPRTAEPPRLARPQTK